MNTNQILGTCTLPGTPWPESPSNSALVEQNLLGPTVHRSRCAVCAWLVRVGTLSRRLARRAGDHHPRCHLPPAPRMPPGQRRPPANNGCLCVPSSHTSLIRHALFVLGGGAARTKRGAQDKCERTALTRGARACGRASVRGGAPSTTSSTAAPEPRNSALSHVPEGGRSGPG